MTTLRRVARFLLLSLGGLVAAIAIAVLGAFVYFHKPYVEVTEVRASSEAETVQVTWNIGCEDSYYEAVDGRRYLPNVPVGGKNPEDFFGGIAMVPGNRLNLTGYRYKALLKNIFTGTVTEGHSERFDVLAWSLVSPYVLRDKDGEHVESNAPIGWKSDMSFPTFGAHATSRPQSAGC
jgi:hypothetical protein